MGVANVGTYNTGGCNVGGTSTGIANVNRQHLGSYSTGSTTGSFSDPATSIPAQHRRLQHRLHRNTGDVNTGAFIEAASATAPSGRAITKASGAHTTHHCSPDPLLNFSVNISVNTPIHLDFGTLAVNGFQIPYTLRALGVTHFSVGPFGRGTPVIDISIGDPGGSSSIPIDHQRRRRSSSATRHPAGPGFGNSTTGPSSGFFSSGGSRLDSETSAPTNSGFWNTAFAGIGNSGLQNFGSLRSAGRTQNAASRASTTPVPDFDAG